MSIGKMLMALFALVLYWWIVIGYLESVCTHSDAKFWYRAMIVFVFANSFHPKHKEGK